MLFEALGRERVTHWEKPFGDSLSAGREAPMGAASFPQPWSTLGTDGRNGGDRGHTRAPSLPQLSLKTSMERLEKGEGRREMPLGSPEGQGKLLELWAGRPSKPESLWRVRVHWCSLLPLPKTGVATTLSIPNCISSLTENKIQWVSSTKPALDQVQNHLFN